MGHTYFPRFCFRVQMTFVLTFLSLNLNGITTVHKWATAESFFKTNDADVIFLQEVCCEHPHLTYPYNVYINVGSNQRGTAILTRPGLELTDVECHPDGRIIAGKLRDVLLVNVYAPSGTQNRVSRNEFYRNTVLYYLRNGRDNIILGGDHNCVLSTIQSSGKPTICWPMQQLVTSLHLVDVVDVLNINHTHYTYVGGVSSSRLDRFYVSTSATSCVRSYSIVPVSFSNHHAVVIKMTGLPQAQTFGRGYWKLNCSNLYAENIYDDFRAVWNSWKRSIVKYTSISDWWIKFAKPATKRFFRQISFQLAREKRSTTEFYYKVLRDLQHLNDSGENVAQEFAQVRRKLLQIQEKSLSGKLITSKDKFFVHGEKHGLYHLVKDAQRGRQFRHLLLNSTHDEMMERITTHFETLYSKQAHNTQASQDLLQHCVLSLSAESRNSLTAPIRPDELESVIKALPHNKSPGVDGIPYEFYQRFWSVIGPEFSRVVSERLDTGKIYPENEHGVIVLIPKSVKPSQPKDFRPITLLCADSKIVARVLANRLKPVLHEVIGEGQTCGIPEGSIIQCLTTVRDTILLHHSYPTNQIGLLNIDFQNAFDRVDHTYLRSVLTHMNFPEHTIQQLIPQTTQCTSRIQVNGFLSRPINICRSVRQGCPLSMLLFIVSLEPVIRSLTNNVVGLSVGGRRISTGAFADDVTVLVRDTSDITSVTHVLDTFQLASGAQINESKTKILWLGDHPPTVHDCRYPFSTEIKILGMICTRSIIQTLDANWSLLVNKIRTLFVLLSTKNVNLLQKVTIVNVFALAKLWYLSQILPMPRQYCAQILKYTGWFLWKGHLFRVPISQLTLPPTRGGLGLVSVSLKARSLLFKTLIHTLTQTTNNTVLLKTAWRYHPIPMRPSQPLPRTFLDTTRLLGEYIVTLPDDTRVTTRAIYEHIYECDPPQPTIARKCPSLQWKRIWKNLGDKHVPSYLRATMYFFINDIVPTALRRHKIHLEADMRCHTCGYIDTALHRLVTCTPVKPLWAWVLTKAARLLIQPPTDLCAYRLINLDFSLFPEVKRRTLVWTICHYVHYVSTNQGTATLPGFKEHLYSARSTLQQNRWMYKHFGHYLHIL